MSILAQNMKCKSTLSLLHIVKQSEDVVLFISICEEIKIIKSHLQQLHPGSLYGCQTGADHNAAGRLLLGHGCEREVVLFLQLCMLRKIQSIIYISLADN